MRRSPAVVVLALVAGLGAGAARVPAAAPATIVVAADRPGAPIAKTMVGVFFEDINFAADGGLYPERVKNRSFEFPDPLMGWQRAVPGAGTLRGAHRRPAELRAMRTTCACGPPTAPVPSA